MTDQAALTASIENALKEKLAELKARASALGLEGVCIKADLASWRTDGPIEWFVHVSAPGYSAPTAYIQSPGLDATFEEVCRRLRWDQAAKMKTLPAPETVA